MYKIVILINCPYCVVFFVLYKDIKMITGIGVNKHCGMVCNSAKILRLTYIYLFIILHYFNTALANKPHISNSSNTLSTNSSMDISYRRVIVFHRNIAG